MRAYGRTDIHDEAQSRFSQFCDTRLKLVDCASVREDGNTKRVTIINLAEICHYFWLMLQQIGMIRPVGQNFYTAHT